MSDTVRVTIPKPEEEVCDMNDNDYGMLKMHALNGSQRQADGAGAYAENQRYSYLEGKDMVSQTESLGHRIITESGSGKARTLADGTPA